MQKKTPHWAGKNLDMSSFSITKMTKWQGRDHVIVLVSSPSSTPAGINKDFQQMRQPGDDRATQCEQRSLVSVRYQKSDRRCRFGKKYLPKCSSAWTEYQLAEPHEGFNPNTDGQVSSLSLLIICPDFPEWFTFLKHWINRIFWHVCFVYVFSLEGWNILTASMSRKLIYTCPSFLTFCRRF